MTYFKSFRSTVCAALCLLGVVSSPIANAAVFQFTFEGALDSAFGFDGFDNLGVFGPANSSIVGKPFQLTYTINTQDGQQVAAGLPDPYIGVFGGTSFGTSAPLHAVFTVDGISVGMGDYNSQMWLGRVGTLSFISLGALNLESNSNLFIYHNISTVIYSDLGLLPESLTSAFDFSFSSNSDPYVWGPASGIDWFETSAGVRRTTQAYLDISTLSFDVLNPDPPFVAFVGCFGGVVSPVRTAWQIENILVYAKEKHRTTKSTIIG